MIPLAFPEKEDAVLGYIAGTGFHDVADPSATRPESFTNPLRSVIYEAALYLHRTGRSANGINIVEAIEADRLLSRIAQDAAKQDGLPDWQTYLAGVASASIQSGKIVSEFLSEITEAAKRRKAVDIGRRLAGGEISIAEALQALADTQPAGAAQQIEPLLDARRISLTNPPPKPLPILKLGGQQISTAGNLTAIAAQAKHGKSAAVGATLASFFGGAEHGGDFLGFESEPANGKAVVLFDTEQSPFDAWQLISRSMRRAGLSKLPPNLRAYAVLDLSVEDRLRALRTELERAAQDCGGIHAIFIDGVADLCLSVNDEAEANGLIADLVALAVKYSCPVICVLHENPAQPGLAGKTRGHLGSQLERKAESNLRIKKDSDGISVIFSERCRSANIPEATAPRFKYCEKAGMHISCESAGVAKAEADREEMREEVREIFNTPDGIAGFSWADVLKRLEEINGIKSSGARKRLEKLTKAGLIKKNSAGLYTR